jgi:S-DNA-T family DNA segregation ATPase FtsK/SpoIIIE
LGGLGKGLGGLGGFGKKDDDKKDAPKSDKPAGGSPLGGLSKGLGGLGGFGKKDDDKKDAPKGDKPAGGNPLGSFASKLPFGGNKDAKPAGPPPPASGGGLGGFGARPPGGGAPSASGGGPLSGNKPLFGASAPAAPAGGAKPATPKSAKAEGGLFKNLKITLPFGGKKSDKPARAKTSKAPKVNQGGLSLDTKLDIVGVALTVVALALLLASLSPNQGAITGEINRFLSYLFGWGALAIPVIMLGAGIWLILRHFGDEAPTVETQRIIGLTVLFISVLAIMQFVEAFGYPQNASALIPQFLEASRSNGRGGGLIGGEIYLFLVNNFTEIGGFALMLIPLIVGLMLALSLSAAEIALIVVSNVRNIRDGARQRAIRAAAERVKKQEQRALALQQAQAQALLNAPQPTAAAALPQPAAQKPALPAPTESPVPLPLPLNNPEPRTIPIMAGGRTVNASVGNEAAPAMAQPSGAQYIAPLPTTSSGAPAAETPAPRSTQERTGLGRLLPTAAAAGAIGAAVKALTPTEESDAPPAQPSEKRGIGLGNFAPKLPFGNKPATPAPATSVGAERVLPSAAPAAPPAVAANVPPPAIAPAPILTPTPAASVGAQHVAPLPAPALPVSPRPEAEGQGVRAVPAEDRPARFGDLLKPQPSGVPGQPPAASGTTSGMATDRPSGLQPRPFTPGTKPSSLTPLPQGEGKDTAPALTPNPPSDPAIGRPSGRGESMPSVGAERVLPSTPAPAPKSAEPAEDDWKSLPRATPKGTAPLPSRPADSPFAPRVMQPRTDANPPATSVGAERVLPSDAPAAPAASTSSSSSPLSTWQERMDAIRGKLPGDSTDKSAASLTGTPSTAKDDPTATRAASILGPDRTPPRIIKMDDAGEEIDEDDEDLIDDDKPAMKPVIGAPTTTPLPGNPFPPRAPITTSSAFNKPDLPAAMMANPRLSPPAPATPAASVGAQYIAPLQPTTSPPVAPPPPAAVVPPEPPAPAAAPVRSGRKEWRKPDPATLLKTGTDQELDHAMLLQRAKTIEETLNSFGAPGRVVEVRTGPVITQFGVEPDYLTVRGGKKTRVKVSAIAQLDKDLQLSLGAKAIRIEAPVPGKGYVGIEVPNDQASVVQLRDVMESEQFKKAKVLGIALGQGVDGTPVAADLTGMPHLLIAGTTGSGKSVCVNSIIASLLLTNTPEQLKFIMVDPKRVELTAYNGIPHLVAPVVVELERIVGVLKWVTREMDERYRRFSSAGARNIEDFNKHLPAGETRMPYIVVIIDELADLMMLAPEETERVITRLAALARATGIHLVIATQRPSVDVVTGLIKANFPARIAFAVAGSVDSRVILDQPGAERLLGRGDMLYMSGDSPAPQRLQGVYVSDSEINNITRYWRQQMDDADLAMQGRPILSDFKLDEMTAKDAGDRRGMSGATGIGMNNQPRQQQMWGDGPTSYVSSRAADDDMVDEDGDGEDDMYDQAVALVRQLRKASVSLLQRRLRIGYTRAAKLIDVMEERGVVGPAQSGSTPRDVIG